MLLGGFFLQKTLRFDGIEEHFSHEINIDWSALRCCSQVLEHWQREAK